MKRRLGVLVAVAVLLSGSGTALARPLYFDTFAATYGFRRGDDLHACGVCHRKWEGTGARNSYGLAVEQQLYIGKSITDALRAVENEDSDLDGFLNLAELTTFRTLPGYSCETQDLAIEPPANFQSLITPGVASCLAPKDLRMKPDEVSFVTRVGERSSAVVELVNNGTDFPITVTGVGFPPGTDPSLAVDGPALPLVIPVGASAAVEITFTPTASALVATTFRVTSDDPDEPLIEAVVNAIGVVLPSASPDQKTACFTAIDKQYRIYSKRHLGEWTRCFVDEVTGRACDAGRRDLKAGQAESRLRSYVGGAKDRDCAGSGMTPVLLGLPSTCAAPCGAIAVTSMATFADCLVCQQEAAAAAMLSASLGAAPPDVPARAVASGTAVCQQRLAKGTAKAITDTHATLARCELANLNAGEPADCAAVNAAELAAIADAVNGQIDRCKETAGLQGCLGMEDADPSCLGDAAVSAGTKLAGATFGTGR